MLVRLNFRVCELYEAFWRNQFPSHGILHLRSEGFEIWVLPILAYGPSAPITLWHYSAYVCRHGTEPPLEGQSTRFYELIKTFDSEDEARDAGYRAGRRLIDSFAG
jgi:hypothetical protein